MSEMVLVTGVTNRPWSRPTLVVLSRPKASEAVLQTCKSPQAENDPGRGCPCAGMQDPCQDCAAS